MKKIVFLLCTAFLYCNSHAQDSTLKAYVGTYTFPEGSMVSLVTITLKDTVLNASSDQGATDLVRQSRDTFSLASYSGSAYFQRDANGAVSGLKVEIEDTVMEGTKQTIAAAEVAPPVPTPAPEQKQPVKGRKKKQ